MGKLKVVIAVDRVKCSSLSGMRMNGKGTAKVPESVSWERVPISTLASLVLADKLDGKVRTYTAQLKFLTCEELSDRDKYAYLATLADGRKLLIGSEERPFPVTMMEESIPQSVKDNQLYGLVISYESSRRIPTISV